MVLAAMPLLRSAANASLAANATTNLQDAMVTSAASVLYVLLLLPALAKNQSIGFSAPYLPYGAGAPALNAGYPAFGFPAYGAGYPSLGGAYGAGVPPVYAAAGSLPAAAPFSGGVGAVGSPGVGGLGLGAGGPLGFSGYGFPAGWPARPLGPVAAALATAYPTLFAAIAGPCRSWCRAPTLPFLFPPSSAAAEPLALGAQYADQPLQALQALLAERDPGRDRPVLRLLRAMFREDDKSDRGPLMRLLFPED